MSRSPNSRLKRVFEDLLLFISEIRPRPPGQFVIRYPNTDYYSHTEQAQHHLLLMTAYTLQIS